MANGHKQGRRWASGGVKHADGRSCVTHMDLAIFCYMLHRTGLIRLPVERVIRLGPGRHEVVFHDPDDVVSKLELEYVNGEGHGEAAKWARSTLSAQRDLKVIMRREDARSGSGRTVHKD